MVRESTQDESSFYSFDFFILDTSSEMETSAVTLEKELTTFGTFTSFRFNRSLSFNFFFDVYTVNIQLGEALGDIWIVARVYTVSLVRRFESSSWRFTRSSRTFFLSLSHSLYDGLIG